MGSIFTSTHLIFSTHSRKSGPIGIEIGKTVFRRLWKFII